MIMVNMLLELIRQKLEFNWQKWQLQGCHSPAPSTGPAQDSDPAAIAGYFMQDNNDSSLSSSIIVDCQTHSRSSHFPEKVGYNYY